MRPRAHTYLVRQEVRSGSELGREISAVIDQGKIVASETTVRLLQNAMGGERGPFLIDGFPRSISNLEAFEATFGSAAFMLFLQVHHPSRTPTRAPNRASNRGHSRLPPPATAHRRSPPPTTALPTRTLSRPSCIHACHECECRTSRPCHASGALQDISHAYPHRAVPGVCSCEWRGHPRPPRGPSRTH